MRNWLRRLFGPARYDARVYASAGRGQVGIGVARHSDTPGDVSLVIETPAIFLEVASSPEAARCIARALFECARDAQEGVPLEEGG